MLDRVRRDGRHRWGFIPVLLAGIALNVHAQDTTVSVPTNLRIYQSLVAELADTLASAVAPTDSATVSVRVYPADVVWFLHEPATRPFIVRGFKLSIADTARYGAELGALEMRVRYSNLRRKGFFGAHILDRSVTIQGALRLVDRRSGNIVITGDRLATYADVIEVSGIESIEHPALPMTHGSVPAEDFFSGLAEPLIVIGAVAVAVYLLFTVRS